MASETPQESDMPEEAERTMEDGAPGGRETLSAAPLVSQRDKTPVESEPPERKSQTRPPPLTAIWQAFLATFLLLAMQFALGVVIALLALLVNYVFKSEEIANALQAYATPVVTLAATWWLALLILLFSRRPISNLWRRGEFHVSILPLVILLILGTSILESEIDNVTRHFFPMPEFIAEIMENVNITPFSGMLLLVFVAPFGEEVFFRGVIMNGFLKRYSPKTALIASSLIFALAHMNPYQFFSAFCAGLVTGTIYLKTRSLWPCIFAHGLNNFLVWAIMNDLHTLISLDIPGYTSGGYGDTASFHPWWFDILGVVITIATIWALVVYFKKRSSDSEKEKKSGMTPPLNGKSDAYAE